MFSKGKHMKDEALKMALEFVEANHLGGQDAFELITAIKQALAAPAYVKTFHGGKPWPLQPAPVQGYVTGLDVYLDPADMKPKRYPAAQPATVQEPVAWVPILTWRWNNEQGYWEGRIITPPAAQPAPSLLEFAQNFLNDYQTEDGMQSMKHYAKEAQAAIDNAPPAQPAPVPLTDEQVATLVFERFTDGRAASKAKSLARAIEAAHGITKGQP
jgi:hypothetical protein